MAKCPTCGRDDAPAPSSNGATHVQFDVPRAALPALESALTIGRNTQMMNRGFEAQAMMEALRLEVRASIPPCARAFRNRHWAAFGARVAAGEKMIATAVGDKRYSWSPQRHVVLHAEGTDPETGYRSEDAFQTQEEAEALIAEIALEVERLTPMTA